MFKNTITAIFGLLTVGLIMLGGANAVNAQSDDVKKELTAIYRQIDKITVEKNIEAIETFLAPDFTAKRDGKELSREEYLKLQAQAAKNIKDITLSESTIEDLDAGEDGEISIKSSQKIKAVVIKDGKETEIEFTSKSIDNWVKTEGGWKIVCSEDLGE